MENNSQELKIQAYLDGELSEAEAREIASLLAQDQAAAHLLGELRFMRQAIKAHERTIKLPETREFFWSKIERQIESAERAQAVRPREHFSLGARLRAWLVPAAAVLLVGLIFVSVNRHSGGSVLQAGEMEIVANDMSALTFRSNAEDLTMVWLYDRADSESTGEKVSAMVPEQ